MNYPTGANENPRAPWHESDTPECPECGEWMEFFDEHEYKRGIVIYEWKCPECQQIIQKRL